MNTCPDSLCQHTATLRKLLAHSEQTLVTYKWRSTTANATKQSASSESSLKIRQLIFVRMLLSFMLTLCILLLGLHTFVFSLWGGRWGSPPPIVFLPKNSFLLVPVLKRAYKKLCDSWEEWCSMLRTGSNHSSHSF